MEMITIKLISWQGISMLVTLLQPKGIQEPQRTSNVVEKEIEEDNILPMLSFFLLINKFWPQGEGGQDRKFELVTSTSRGIVLGLRTHIVNNTK